jgi:hypothetical protein
MCATLTRDGKIAGSKGNDDNRGCFWVTRYPIVPSSSTSAWRRTYRRAHRRTWNRTDRYAGIWNDRGGTCDWSWRNARRTISDRIGIGKRARARHSLPPDITAGLRGTGRISRRPALTGRATRLGVPGIRAGLCRNERQRCDARQHDAKQFNLIHLIPFHDFVFLPSMRGWTKYAEAS